MTDTPLTAEELAELLDGAENAELFEVSRAEFARTLRDALALIATLTTRAEQAEAALKSNAFKQSDWDSDISKWAARVAELTAALDEMRKAYHHVVHRGELDECELLLCQRARRVLAGKEAQG